MRTWLLALLIAAPVAGHAENSHNGPLFMKNLLGDKEFFAPWGVGIDVFNMQQEYRIKELSFQLPGVPGIGPSKIGVSNDLQHVDLKLDVWLTPFLNVYGIIGHLDGSTHVDLSSVPLPGLPFPLGNLPVSYDGTVYGFGTVLVYGTERWFAAVDANWTDSNLSGDFNSSVSSFAAQPRLGLNFGGWSYWVGGMYLDAEEKHSGVFTLPIPDPANPAQGLNVPFAVTLQSGNKWNYAVGAALVFSPRAHFALEVGFGDRDYTLFNFTYRF